MAIVGAGVTLFVLVVGLSTAAMSALFFAVLFPGGWSPSSSYPYWFAQGISALVGPTVLLLMLAAARGWKPRAVLGITSMSLFGLAWTIGQYLIAINGDEIAASWASLAWVPFILGVASILPVFLLCYFARKLLRLQPILGD